MGKIYSSKKMEKDTGEIIEFDERYVKNKQSEHYIMLFATDIARITGLRDGAGRVLFKILSLSDFKNEVHISPDQKKIIAKDLDRGEQAITKSIKALIGAKLIKVDSNDKHKFMLNPEIFYKGEWNLRDKKISEYKNIEVKITYDKNGRSMSVNPSK